MNKSIIFFTEYSGIGGGESSLINLVESLSKEHIKIKVVTQKYGDLNNNLKKLLIDQETLDYKNLIRKFRLTTLLSSLRKLLENMDMVILNSKSGLYLLPFINLLNKQISVIYIEHSNWTNYTFVEKWLLNKCNKIFAVSKTVSKHLSKQLKPGVEVIIFPLGVPIENEVPVKSINNKKIINIAMIGRFQRIKGHSFFVNLAHLLKVYENQAFNFLIIGGKPFGTQEENDYEQEILNQIQRLKMESKISLLGDRRDVETLLENEIDILIVPSHNESFGMVVLEAAGKGVPIITSTNCEGPSEILIEMGLTNVITERSEEAFKEVILNLVKSPLDYEAVSRSLGINVQKFNVKNTQKVLLEHLSSL